MAKGLIAGGTNYNHQSLDDIINDLKEEKSWVNSTSNSIKSNIKILVENSYWELNVLPEFRNIIHYSLKLYDTTISEIEDIINDIKIEIKDHHVTRLRKISEESDKLNILIGQIWHQKYNIKNYNDPNFRIVDSIYIETREIAVNLLDISSMAERLKDFVGRVSQQNTIPKKKLELSHKIALVSVGLALIVLLFGNNLVGRINVSVDSMMENNIHSIDSTKKTIFVREEIIDSLELPYLSNYPILDKGLFIKHYFTEFIIGGPNIDSISINSRTKTGEKIEIRKSNKIIEIDIYQEPYIELKYKNIFYSIDIYNKDDRFICIIIKSINPTLNLKEFVLI